MRCFPPNHKPTSETPFDLEAWIAGLCLPEITANLIRRAVSNPPVRAVGGGGQAMPGRFISKKNDGTVDYESLRGEAVLYPVLEWDESTLAFFAQAAVLSISYLNRKGITVNTQCTPDALVLKKSGPTFVECKFASTLENLATEQPNKWVKTAEGRWTCPPAEAAAKEFGIGYEIFIAEGYQVFARNYEVLSDFYLEECPRPPADAQIAVQMALAANPMQPTTLSEVLDKSGASIDQIYAMVVAGLIHIDLNREPLDHRKLVHVWQSRHHEELARRMSFENCPAESGVPSTLAVGSVFTLCDKLSRISLITPDDVFFVGENQTETKLGVREFLDLVKNKLVRSHGEVTDHPRVQEAKRRLAAASPQETQEA